MCCISCLAEYIKDRVICGWRPQTEISWTFLNWKANIWWFEHIGCMHVVPLWICCFFPLQHPYSGGAPLLLQSVENIAESVAVNLASNQMANVTENGSMEAVFMREHLCKEWLQGVFWTITYPFWLRAHTYTHTARTYMHVTPLPPSCLSSAIQVAQLMPEPTNNDGTMTYNDVIYPNDQGAISGVASSLDIPSSMVPQMVIPGTLLEERASAWADFLASSETWFHPNCVHALLSVLFLALVAWAATDTPSAIPPFPLQLLTWLFLWWMSFSTILGASCPACSEMEGTVQCAVGYNPIQQTHCWVQRSTPLSVNEHYTAHNALTDTASLQRHLTNSEKQFCNRDSIYVFAVLGFEQWLPITVEVQVHCTYTSWCTSANSSIGSLQLGSLLISGRVARIQASSDILHIRPVSITFPIPVSNAQCLVETPTHAVVLVTAIAWMCYKNTNIFHRTNLRGLWLHFNVYIGISLLTLQLHQGGTHAWAVIIRSIYASGFYIIRLCFIYYLCVRMSSSYSDHRQCPAWRLVFWRSAGVRQLGSGEHSGSMWEYSSHQFCHSGGLQWTSGSESSSMPASLHTFPPLYLQFTLPFSSTSFVHHSFFLHSFFPIHAALPTFFSPSFLPT